MKNIILILLFLVPIKVLGQDYKEKKSYLLGTFHTHNTTINGISLGAFPNFRGEKRFVRTNGIRLEIPGIGCAAFMSNGSLLRPEETDEIVNGLNISSGTIGNISYNGMTLGLVTQSGTKINGIAIAGLWNAMNKSNGIQISGLLNEAEYNIGIQISLLNSSRYMKGLQIGAVNYGFEEMYGLQLGIYNRSKNTKGIQLGIWNINEKENSQ